jgi:predicted adenylyl cyclase CyaB
MVEREIKIRLRTEEAAIRVERLLTCAYGAATSSVFQRDEYFDRSDRLLADRDFVVRLRVIDHSRFFLALKGPRLFSESNASERIELEFQYPDEGSIRKQLSDKGFEVSAVYEKARKEWRLKDRCIAIDYLPLLGPFIEIEADSNERLTETMIELSVPLADAIKLNYSELLREEMLRIGMSTEPVLRAEFV